MSTENDRIRRELGTQLIEAERRAGMQQPVAPKPAPPAPKEPTR